MNPRDVRQIGRYPVTRFHAEGGMAWVFEVTDPEAFDARRALKLLKPAAAVGEEFNRFLAEAKLLASIQHPNLVHLFTFGKDEGTSCHFYTMDFIEGSTLADLQPTWLGGSAAVTQLTADPDATGLVQDVDVASRPHSLEEVCRYFDGVLSALSRLHRAGIVHRDVKPQNIFLTRDGIAILGDLGIAKDHESAGVTRAGVTPGTPLYMSPEHSLGENVTLRSDLFSVGLTMYRVITGKTIYDHAEGVDSTNSQAVLRHLWQLHGQHGEFQFVFPHRIPESLREVIRTACRMNESERYRTADAMAEALREATGRIGAERTGRVGPPVAEAGRSFMAPAIAAAAAVVLLGSAYLVYNYFATGSATAEALQMRDQSLALGQRATGLVDWLAGLEDPPSSAALDKVRVQIRYTEEDLREGERDIEDGSLDRAERMFAKSQGSFVQICDDLANAHLVAAADRGLKVARDSMLLVPGAAERHASDVWGELQTLVAKLDAPLAPAGCERAEGLKERVDLGRRVVAQATVVQNVVSERLPRIVASELAQSEEAKRIATRNSVALDPYKNAIRTAEEQLKEARNAEKRGEYEAALAAASQATKTFTNASVIGPTYEAREATRRAVDELESRDLRLGPLRSRYMAAQESYEADEWAKAGALFAELQAEITNVLRGAEPGLAARDDAEAARGRALEAGVSLVALAEADGLRQAGLEKLRAGELEGSVEASQKAMHAYMDALAEKDRRAAESAEAERRQEEQRRLAEAQARSEDEQRQAAERQRAEQEQAQRAQQQQVADEQRRQEEQRLAADAKARAERQRESDEQKARQLAAERAEADRKRFEREKAAALEAEIEKAKLASEAAKRAKAEPAPPPAPKPAQKPTPPPEEEMLVAEIPKPAPPAPAKPPSSQEAQVRSALEEYGAAYQARDLDRLNLVWSMSVPERLMMRSEFRKCAEVTVQLDLASIEVNGRKAMADFKQKIGYDECTGGAQKPVTAELTAELILRGGDEWQITRIAPRK